MKTKINFRISVLIVFICSLFIIYSCSKSENAGSTKEQSDQNPEAVLIDENNFTESDEDLATVDYKEIYEQLTPAGEWLQVNPEEIGMKPGTALLNERDNNGLSLSDLIGIKKSFAETAEAGMIYVWKPSVELGVAFTAGEAKVFTPYSNGQWVNSDAGWYFKAPTPEEEIVSHYGRWVNSPSAGWLWVPGRVWAPAWVDWKQNDKFVSWAPLPPSVYLNNGTLSVPVIKDNYYTAVGNKYFLEPQIYRYNYINYDYGYPVLINEMTRTGGIVIVNNTIINRGPDVTIFQELYGRNIEKIKIKHNRNHKEVRYSDREYVVYTPDFKRYKNKGNASGMKNNPVRYKRYDEWKISNSSVNETEKVEKNNGKDNNGNNNDKNNGTGYDKKNNGSGNDNDVNKNGGNNGNNNKGNDKGKKNTNNNSNNDNKGNKNDRDDNGKKSNDNNKDNGNKQNGNDNGKKNDENNNGKK